MKSSVTNPLTAVTTLDGRYREKVDNLSQYVSEQALIQARYTIEVRYLLALSQAGIIREFTKQETKELEKLITNFSDKDAKRVKEIEEKTRHDVKAVEYLLREKLEKSSLKDVSEKIHLCLTSEDINNIAQRIIILNALEEEIVPQLKMILQDLLQKSDTYKSVPMLARTHGQAAVPTTIGKEFAVFASRLQTQMNKLETTQLTGKLSGAVGNYNSFKFAYPEKSYKEWIMFSQEFVSQFNLVLNKTTTQINSYEDIIELLQILQRINGILTDLSSDCWRYISDGWFVLEKIKEEVGSSTMPQKINPIDFENGEGNLALANDVIGGLVNRLPVSRLQRDLRDSTQIRNIGLIFGFMTVGMQSIQKGLSKLIVNKGLIHEVLHSDWGILSEGAQTWLKVHENINDPYALLKEATRGKKMGEKEWKEMINGLKISEKAKKALVTLTPENYIGFATDIVLSLDTD